MINCLDTYRKTLACWVFGGDKWAVTIRVHAPAFHRNGDKDLNPGHPGLGQFKGPWEGFVSGINVCPSPSKWSYTEIAVLHQDACWGVRLSVPSHATLELLNLPGEQDPWFMHHEVRGTQHNPLIWYYVQCKLGGLLISARAFFFLFPSFRKKGVNKPKICDLMVSSDGESTAWLSKLLQCLIVLMKSMELL